MQATDSEKDEYKEKYGRCSFYNDGKCGPHKWRKPPVDGMFAVGELTEEVTPHFISLKLIKKNATTEWTEQKLIENRIGRSLLVQEMLCAYHRYKNGIWWKQPLSCAVGDHSQEKGKQVPKGGVATIARSLEMGIPVGSTLCHRHRLEIQETRSELDAPDVDIPDDNIFLFVCIFVQGR